MNICFSHIAFRAKSPGVEPRSSLKDAQFASSLRELCVMCSDEKGIKSQSLSNLFFFFFLHVASESVARPLRPHPTSHFWRTEGKDCSVFTFSTSPGFFWRGSWEMEPYPTVLNKAGVSNSKCNPKCWELYKYIHLKLRRNKEECGIGRGSAEHSCANKSL